MSGEESLFFEDEGIDPERIVNDEHLAADEFLCEICRGLLWKPLSCASCQHLFCNKCIRTWLKINPTSCPFRCSPYEEKRPPPYIQSLLARLSIRCRNHSFGCTEILPYNSLEQHQTIECQFPTKRCRVCEKYILIGEIDQHQKSCIPATIECSMCKRVVDRVLFQQHQTECFQERLNLLIEQIIPSPSPDAIEVPMNNPFAFLQDRGYDNWFIRFIVRLHRFLSAMPKINLVGFEATVQARQQTRWDRMWTVFRLISLNISRAPQIIMFLLFYGVGGVIGCLICLSLIIQNQVNVSMYRSFALIILLSGLFTFAFPVLLAMISDTLIIVFTIVSSALWSSARTELPLDYLLIYQHPTMVAIFYSVILLTFKLSLLIIRLYVWYIPPYISAGCLAWITIFITFHIRRIRRG